MYLQYKKQPQLRIIMNKQKLQQQSEEKESNKKAKT